MITDAVIAHTVRTYLESHPNEIGPLADALQLLDSSGDFASRKSFPMHATVGALLVRSDDEILLVEHRAYGILLQPGGHLEPTDTTLIDAALRELIEETGIDPSRVAAVSGRPVYIEYGPVPARPDKDEPVHHHLDIGYAFVTDADVGRVQESEVTGAGWYPLTAATSLVGQRVQRARRPG